MPRTADGRPMMHVTSDGLRPGREVSVPLANEILITLAENGGALEDHDGRVSRRLAEMLEYLWTDGTRSAFGSALKELTNEGLIKRDMRKKRTYYIELLDASVLLDPCVNRIVVQSVPQNEVEVEDQIVPESELNPEDTNRDPNLEYDDTPAGYTGGPLDEVDDDNDDDELDYDELAYALLRKAIESSQRRDEIEEQHKQEHDDLIRRMSQMAEEIRQTKAEANRLREKLRQAHKDEQSLQAERDQLREELRAAQAKTRNGHTVAERIDDQTRAGLEKLLREPRS